MLREGDSIRFCQPDKDNRLAELENPLQFECGAKGEFTVDGWKVGPTKK